MAILDRGVILCRSRKGLTVKQLSALLILLSLAAPAAAAGPDAILGVWQTGLTDHGYAHVEIFRQGELFRGRVVWLSEPDFPPGDEMAGEPKSDRLNPDPALRGQPIIGLPLMEDFQYVGGRWKGGRIYDPESGRIYKGSIRLEGDASLRLRGYLGVSLLGRTTVWTRTATE